MAGEKLLAILLRSGADECVRPYVSRVYVTGTDAIVTRSGGAFPPRAPSRRAEPRKTLWTCGALFENRLRQHDRWADRARLRL